MIRSVRRCYRADPRAHRRRRDVGGRRARRGAGRARSVFVRAPSSTRGWPAAPRFRRSPRSASCSAARKLMSRRSRDGRARMARPSPVPLLAIHGEADSVVAPVNADRAGPPVSAIQRASGGARAVIAASTLPVADAERYVHRPRSRGDHARMAKGRSPRRALRLVAGLGHAWSGGDDALPFNDAQGARRDARCSATFVQRGSKRRQGRRRAKRSAVGPASHWRATPPAAQPERCPRPP